MKKTILRASLLACGLLISFAGVASALPAAGDTVRIYNGPGNTGGGEFKIDLASNGYTLGTYDYISFCLERNETISLTTSNTDIDEYRIDSVEDYAHSAFPGQNGADADGKDKLSEATKWLYYNYMFGNYDWSRSGSESTAQIRANNVQNTIWYLEEEQASGYQPLVDLLNTQLDYTIAGTVKVLNLVDGNDIKRQSQIIGEPVPEPGAMMLMGTGILGLSAIARRRKK